MKARTAIAFVAIAFASSAHGQEKTWEFSATGYWNDPRGSDAFASGIFTADHDALHLEVRANYEAVHAQSAFVGYSFSWGKEVTLDLRPIVGGVTGTARGPIAGLEATVATGPFDYYIEAEHVNDRVGGNYNYAWTELGWRPAEWLRVGFAGQHTRVYGGDRETQRGGLIQLTHGKFTLSGYWFNPGTSDQIAIVALGASF
jgi:hypothetical protein